MAPGPKLPRGAPSTSGRGSICIECHTRQQGQQNDLVRTFERQN